MDDSTFALSDDDDDRDTVDERSALLPKVNYALGDCLVSYHK
jgi:hypothetical protein